MLARLRRRGFTPLRRSRRALAALLVLAGLVSLAVGEVAADVVDSARPTALVSDRSYVAAIVPVVDESNALEPWLAAVRSRSSSLGRVGLFDALAHLVTGAESVSQQVSDLGIPPPSRRCRRLLRSVFADRLAGARLLESGVSDALSSVPGALNAFSRAGVDLQDSDAAYIAFRRSLPRRLHQDAARLPRSLWAGGLSWTPSTMDAYLAALESDPRLRAHDGLRILALTLQPPVLRITPTTTTTTTTSTTTTSTTTTTTTTTTLPETSSTSTTTSTTSPPTTTSTSTTTTTLQLPPRNSTSWIGPTSHLSVVVVAGNEGNVPLIGISLRVTARPVARARHLRGAAPTVRIRRRVGMLSSGGSRVVVVGMKVVPGVVYELTVTVSAGPGAGLSDTESVRVDDAL